MRWWYLFIITDVSLLHCGGGDGVESEEEEERIAELDRFRFKDIVWQ